MLLADKHDDKGVRGYQEILDRYVHHR